MSTRAAATAAAEDATRSLCGNAQRERDRERERTAASAAASSLTQAL